MSKVIVVGGGAAGMMAAVTAAENGHEVTLIEHNEKLGKKLFITGKGRCNVTNACETEKLFDNVVSNPKFLYSAFYDFDSKAVMEFFEQLGVRLKIERGERVFPRSDHSSDIISALQYELRRLGVNVMLRTELTALITEELTASDEETQKTEAKPEETAEAKDSVPQTDPVQEKTQKDQTVSCGKKDKWAAKSKKQKGPVKRILGVCYTDQSGKKQKLLADKVILATGGVSYPLTGASDIGMKLSEECGHKVTELYPALVPLRIKEAWCKELMGLSLRNVELTVWQDKEESYRAFGEMLFTHYGVSGPLVLSASSYITKLCGKKELTLSIDLKPALSIEQLDKRLLREFETNHAKQFKNILGSLFPAKLIPVMVRLSGIEPEKKAGDITKKERLAFGELIKKLLLTVEGTSDFGEAIITQGGVNIKEVNPSTMESKKVKGLYFAGEMLDLDALTGGFNLQIAWSTGHLAGQLG